MSKIAIRSGQAARLMTTVLLFALSSHSFSQNVGGTPLYGSTNLSGGWTPDPFVVAITAGGASQVSDLGAGCTGYITESQPDFNINLSNAGSDFGLYVRASVDTTLIVNMPNGEWRCNDDSTAAGSTNPGIEFSNPQDGLYNVWIGTYSEIDVTEALLAITEYASSAWANTVLIVSPTNSTSSNVPQIGSSRYDTVSLDVAFTPDPYIVEVVAGGAMDVDDLGAACTGYIAGSQPDVNLDYQGTADLGIYVNSDSDTTLVVNRPDGSWSCNDDSSYLLNANPGLYFENAATGIYNIWIGTFSEGSNADALLAFTEYATSQWSNNLGGDTITPPTDERAIPIPGPSRYSELSLRAHFTPDPTVVDVFAGGALQVDNLNAGCAGFINPTQPTLNLNFQDGGTDLGIFVEADRDLTLLINNPSGGWDCNDDSSELGNNNPSLLFENAEAGTYYIWIGTWSAEDGDGAPGKLVFTEQSSTRWSSLNLETPAILGDNVESLEVDDVDVPR